MANTNIINKDTYINPLNFLIDMIIYLMPILWKINNYDDNMEIWI